MSKNTVLTTTLQYKGIFDTSDIVRKVKDLRNQLKGQASQNDLLNVDTQIKKIEELQAKIKQSTSKGYSSPAELKATMKDYDNLLNIASRLKNSFNDIHLTGLNNEFVKLKKELAEAQDQLKAMESTFKSQLQTSFTGVKKGNSYAQQFVDAAKAGEDLKSVQNKVTAEMQAQLDVMKNQQTIAQQQLDAANAKLTNAQNKAYSITGQPGANINRRSVTDIKSGKDLSQLSTAQSNKKWEKVQEIYKQVASTMTDSSKAVKQFNEELEKNGLAFKNEDLIIKAFNSSLESKKNGAVSVAQASVNSAKKQVNKINTNIQGAELEQKQVSSAINSQALIDAYNNVGNAAANAADKERQVTEAGTHLNDANPNVEAFGNDIRDATQQVEQMGKANAEAAEKATNMQQSFNRISDTVKRLFSVYNIFYKIRSIISETFNDVKNLDQAFAQIAMVTSYSVEDMWESYDQYAQMAQELGQTTESVVQSSALFYQQGLDTAESLELTTSTMKLATLAGTDFQEATSQMTAALRGFHMEMDQGEHVTDVYSELAAHAAADVNTFSVIIF